MVIEARSECLLWTTTSARMPGGPRTRMLFFSSSAFKPTRRASQHVTRRTASCHKSVRFPFFMQEMAWLPWRSTTFMESGQPFMVSSEDLWQRAHLKFSLTGRVVGKRSRLKNMISKSRFSIDVKESVGMVAKVWASPRFEIWRAVRQG